MKKFAKVKQSDKVPGVIKAQKEKVEPKPEPVKPKATRRKPVKRKPKKK